MTFLDQSTDKKKDPRFLERDDLERELVRRNKQSLIDDCLKIFDTNTMLFEQIETQKAMTAQLEDEKGKLIIQVDMLRQRKWWQLINDRLMWQIEKMRKRRSTVNYPMK